MGVPCLPEARILTTSHPLVPLGAAPFKLTRELLEVMDSNAEGKASELFDYFKVLLPLGGTMVLLLLLGPAALGVYCWRALRRVGCPARCCASATRHR